MRRRWFALVGSIGMLGAALPALAQDAMDVKEAGVEQAPPPVEEPRGAQPLPDPTPGGKDDDPSSIYIPPSRGTVETRAGAGTRAPGRLPDVEVLAPLHHVGTTTRPDPVLGWFISGSSDTPVVLTLTEPGRAEPLLERTVAERTLPGFHFASLEQLGVRLAAGADYEWSVALVVDPKRRDRDVVSSAAIRLVSADPELQQGLISGPDAYRALAQRGVWYDAIASLSDAIALRPSDARLRRQRAALLEQVGLTAAAAQDRATVAH